MTITLTTEEFGKFADRVQSWHRARSLYLFDHLNEITDSMTHEPIRARLDKVLSDFAAKNPEPHWRSLLE